MTQIDNLYIRPMAKIREEMRDRKIVLKKAEEKSLKWAIREGIVRVMRLPHIIAGFAPSLLLAATLTT